jgi:hypothetical protein
MTTQELIDNLQTELWDFYKDVHGIRPRHWTESQWNDIYFLQAQRKNLLNYLAGMTQEQRIEEGWTA